MKKPVLLYETCFGSGDYPCQDTVSRDGRVMIPISGGCDEPYLLYSEDRGYSFEKRPFPPGMRDVGSPFRQLEDGTFLALGFLNAGFSAIANFDYGDIPFAAAVYRADSFDDLLAGRISTEFSPIAIPGLAAGWGDSGNRHTGCFAGWRELGDGTIYASMYGQFREDTTLCPYFAEHGGYEFFLYRSWGVRSDDGGHTWAFVSTIADCQTYPIADGNAEGYCEPDVIELEPGHLFCALRTGGHEVFSPLYGTDSYDGGRTWEAPREICPWGVLPRLLRMANGTLVIASGHRHTMLLFSEDGGRSWSQPFLVEECDGLWDRSATGYDSVFESAPGVLTVVYADPKAGIAEGARDHRKRRVYAKAFRIAEASRPI